MFRSRVYSLRLAVLAATVFCLSVPVALADQFFDNDGNDGLWTTASNWDLNTVPNAEAVDMFLHEQVNSLPLVGGIPTITLDSGNQTITSFRLGFETPTDLGDIQLLVTGGTLNLSADSNVGHGAGSTGPEDYTAYLRLEGGTINTTGGSGVDLKLSNSGQSFRPAGVLSIAGGSFISNGTINMGSTAGSATSGAAILEIDGSGAIAIQIEDLKMESGGSEAIFRPIIDAGGITPVEVNDDLQMESLQLDLQLSDVPPAGDIVLFTADRISNDNQFVGFPDGSDVSATFGLNLYTWTINYFDGLDDAVIIDAIVLSNLRVSLIPEPTSLILLGFGGLALVGLRRRS